MNEYGLPIVIWIDDWMNKWLRMDLCSMIIMQTQRHVSLSLYLGSEHSNGMFKSDDWSWDKHQEQPIMRIQKWRSCKAGGK